MEGSPGTQGDPTHSSGETDRMEGSPGDPTHNSGETDRMEGSPGDPRGPDSTDRMEGDPRGPGFIAVRKLIEWKAAIEPKLFDFDCFRLL